MVSFLVRYTVIVDNTKIQCGKQQYKSDCALNYCCIASAVANGPIHRIAT